LTNKKIKNATNTEFEGIKFRSKLEKFTYRKAKELGIDLDYEDKTFTLMESCMYMGEKIRPITFTPDFVGKTLPVIIECKGWSNDVFPLKWKLFKKHLLDTEQIYFLYLPKNQKQVLETLTTIKNKFQNE
jgi:hypothetical protein